MFIFEDVDLGTETLEITKKDIENLIGVEKEDTFLHHLRTVFLCNLQPTGEIGKHQIKIWRRNIWNSSFYPIFTFKLNTNDHLVDITDTPNPVGKLLLAIFIIGFPALIFSDGLIEFGMLGYWFPVLVIAIFLMVVIYAARQIYNYEKQNQLEEIFELLAIETEEKVPEKEWSLKNICIRVCAYLFCAFLIFLNVTLIISQKGYMLTLGTVIFVIPYLYTDIKIWSNKLKQKH